MKIMQNRFHTKFAWERFNHYFEVDASTKCWNWTSTLSKKGYGEMWDGQKKTSAHRFSYTSYVDSIPEGYQIDHLCRNRKCVNPFHLEAVTPLENTTRSPLNPPLIAGIERGRLRTLEYESRTSCVHGHEYTKENTNFYMNKKGIKRRRCKICQSVTNKKWEMNRMEAW